MICNVCGEEVRVLVTLARYSEVTYGVNDDGERNDDDCEIKSHWNDIQGIDEHEVEFVVVCECETCPYVLDGEKVVSRPVIYGIDKIRKLGPRYSPLGFTQCSKCDQSATHCVQRKTWAMSASGFYYYCDDCLPEKYQGGIGTYSEEWEDV